MNQGIRTVVYPAKDSANGSEYSKEEFQAAAKTWAGPTTRWSRLASAGDSASG